MRQTQIFDNFSGGLDLVSSLQRVPEGFTPNAMNFRISEYGGLEKILGYEAFATADLAMHDLFYFQKADGSSKRLIAASATKWHAIDSAGNETDIRTGMTSTTDTSFVATDDLVYGLDASNDLASWDGSTLTTYAVGVNTGPPRGTILGIWNSRMYVAPAANPMRVVWSEPGEFTGTGSWPADNFVDLVAPTSSDKIVGGAVLPDALVVFGRSSAFAIYDSATGANRIVDPQLGCASRRSIVVHDGAAFGVSDDGVFRTSGSFSLEIVSRRIEPLFAEDRADLTIAAAVKFRRSMLFSYARDAATNDLTLDLDPVAGTWMSNSYPMLDAVVAKFDADDDLYFIDATDATKIRKGFSGGEFVDAPITCYYDLPPAILGGDDRILKRLHRVRVVGRGAGLQVGVRADYFSDLRLQTDLAFSIGDGIPSLWGSAIWGAATFGGDDISEGFARLPLKARRHALRFAQTGSDTLDGRNVLNSPGETFGGLGIYLAEPGFTTSTRYR